LWTHAGDSNVGDINGHDIYDVELAQDAQTKIDVGTPMDAIAALYWGIMPP
jgi:hypothetical protein